MNELNEKFMDLTSEIVSKLTEIAEFKPKSYHAVWKGPSATFNTSLAEFRKRLSDLDDELKPHVKMPGGYNSIQIVSGKLSVDFFTRNVSLLSLDEAQRMLSGHETTAGFKFTTVLSLTAIVIAVMSLFRG